MSDSKRGALTPETLLRAFQAASRMKEGGQWNQASSDTPLHITPRLVPTGWTTLQSTSFTIALEQGLLVGDEDGSVKLLQVVVSVLAQGQIPIYALRGADFYVVPSFIWRLVRDADKGRMGVGNAIRTILYDCFVGDDFGEYVGLTPALMLDDSCLLKSAVAQGLKDAEGSDVDRAVAALRALGRPITDRGIGTQIAMEQLGSDEKDPGVKRKADSLRKRRDIVERVALEKGGGEAQEVDFPSNSCKIPLTIQIELHTSASRSSVHAGLTGLKRMEISSEQRSRRRALRIHP